MPQAERSTPSPVSARALTMLSATTVACSKVKISITIQTVYDIVEGVGRDVQVTLCVQRAIPTQDHGQTRAYDA